MIITDHKVEHVTCSWQNEDETTKAQYPQEAYYHENHTSPGRMSNDFDKNYCDAWVCPCGNDQRSDGFHPCDLNGNEVDAIDMMQNSYHLFRCAECGRIIEQEQGYVVGRALDVKYL